MPFNFKHKDITEDSLGEILQAKRKQRNISLEQAAVATKINLKHLLALENNDYKSLPEGIYGRNFLREYGRYLGLNCKELASLFEAECQLIKAGSDEKIFKQQRPKRHYFLSLPKVARNIILIAVLIVGFSFLGFKVRQIIAPPVLLVTHPAAYYITAEHKIILSGQTDPEARLFVNGREILTEDNGQFSAEINLQSGLNTINIKASRKYSRTAETRREVLVK